ncbi:hypothetical protein M1Q06_12900 [Planococcus sp. 11815]|uniref:hypothetical protein n=1 Tax=Planococcus sp. 11815 TaxID=2939413 RepID=UPI003DA368EA
MKLAVMGNNCANGAFGWHRDSKYIRSRQANERWRETRLGGSVFVWRWPFSHFRVIVQLPVLVQREIFSGTVSTRGFPFDQLVDGSFTNRFNLFNLESRYCGRFSTKPVNARRILHLWWHLNPERAIMKSTDTSRMNRISWETVSYQFTNL